MAKRRQKEEEWRRIWLDREQTNFEVSSWGRIRHAKTHYIKTQHVSSAGTMIVMIYSPGRGDQRMVSVAVLVARAFLGEPAGDEQIEHMNQDRQDNRIDNLAYVTQSTNILRSYWYGRRKRATNSNRYLSQASHDLVERLWQTGRYSQVEIGKVLGINNSSVSKILSGSIKARQNGYVLLIPDWSKIPGGCRHE